MAYRISTRLQPHGQDKLERGCNDATVDKRVKLLLKKRICTLANPPGNQGAPLGLHLKQTKRRREDSGGHSSTISGGSDDSGSDSDSDSGSTKSASKKTHAKEKLKSTLKAYPRIVALTCKGSSIWKTLEALRGIVPGESTSALSAIKSTLGQPEGVHWGTL